jgi:hypothetical protein
MALPWGIFEPRHLLQLRFKLAALSFSVFLRPCTVSTPRLLLLLKEHSDLHVQGGRVAVPSLHEGELAVKAVGAKLSALQTYLPEEVVLLRPGVAIHDCETQRIANAVVRDLSFMVPHRI